MHITKERILLIIRHFQNKSEDLTNNEIKAFNRNRFSFYGYDTNGFLNLENSHFLKRFNILAL